MGQQHDLSHKWQFKLEWKNRFVHHGNHVVLESQDSVVNIQFSQILLVNAHLVFTLNFSQSLLHVVPGQVVQFTLKIRKVCCGKQRKLDVAILSCKINLHQECQEQFYKRHVFPSSGKYCIRRIRAELSKISAQLPAWTTCRNWTPQRMPQQE